MPNPSLDDVDRQTGRASTLPQRVDLDLVLVVSNSPITRVVISRIAERAGLRVISGSPDDASTSLLTRWPGTVILDGGADDHECDGLVESLAAQRLAAGGRTPFVILLHNTTPKDGAPAKGGTIDAIVTKPISPDRLQPLIRGMIDRIRG